MRQVEACIEELRLKFSKYRNQSLKEIPTRTIFIDPLLAALGWDVTNPDEVQLEYTTIDGKSVDYAAKINRKPVLFVEAKPLNDSLKDVKAITQLVGYAANAGVEWSVLTNGITYKVYCSSKKCAAPEKLLFEVSINNQDDEKMPVQQVAKQLNRFSRNSMAEGILDDLGQKIFTTAIVRKALDKIFADPPKNLIKLVRNNAPDDSLKPKQIKVALKRLWAQTSETEIPESEAKNYQVAETAQPIGKTGKYTEEYLLREKPAEVVELYRSLDQYCRELDPANVNKKFLSRYMNFIVGKTVFCSVKLWKSCINVYLKLNYSDLQNPPEYARDVTNVGHSGVGDLRIRIDAFDKLQQVKPLIRESFERCK